MKTLKLAAFTITLFIFGCGSLHDTKQQPLEVEIIQSSLQCKAPQKNPWGKWLHSTEQLIEAENNANYSRFNYQPNLQVDFSQFEVVVAGMGIKPTLGYSMQLIEPVKWINKERLQLTLQLNNPSADRMQGQAVTSPCVLIKLPKTDAKEIEVVDQQGVQLVVLSR